MRYIEIKIEIEPKDLEEAARYLEDVGIFTFSMEDPAVTEEILNKQNPYEWDYVDERFLQEEGRQSSITFYLEENEQVRAKELSAEIEKRGWQASEKLVDEAEWKDRYKEHFRSINLSDRIQIVPSWESHPGKAGRDYISMDPGMAFGTGDHATTSMCVHLLEKSGCRGKKVLDVGTGSGILAICAAMLGSCNVMGIDIDPEAVEIARQNVGRNYQSGIVTVEERDIMNGLTYRADIVVANLMAEMILKMSEHVKENLCQGGTFISSGILSEKADAVTTKLKEEGLVIKEITHKEGWAAIAAEYPGI